MRESLPRARIPNAGGTSTPCTKVRARKPYLRPARGASLRETIRRRRPTDTKQKRCLGVRSIPHRLRGDPAGYSAARGAREETQSVVLVTGKTGNAGRHVPSLRRGAVSVLRPSKRGDGRAS